MNGENENKHDEDGKPATQSFSDDVVEILNKYELQGMTYEETVGTFLSIINQISGVSGKKPEKLMPNHMMAEISSAIYKRDGELSFEETTGVLWLILDEVIKASKRRMDYSDL